MVPYYSLKLLTPPPSQLKTHKYLRETQQEHYYDAVSGGGRSELVRSFDLREIQSV